MKTRRLECNKHPSSPLYCYRSKFARLAHIFRESKTLGFGYSSRKGAKTLSWEEKITIHNQLHSLLSDLCALVSLREIIRFLFFALYAPIALSPSKGAVNSLLLYCVRPFTPRASSMIFTAGLTSICSGPSTKKYFLPARRRCGAGTLSLGMSTRSESRSP